MLKLVSEKDSLPGSLVPFGNVFRGEYEGQQVALKALRSGKGRVSALLFFSLNNIDLSQKDLFRKKRPLHGYSMDITRPPLHPSPTGDIRGEITTVSRVTLYSMNRITVISGSTPSQVVTLGHQSKVCPPVPWPSTGREASTFHRPTHAQ